jgi:hypothetical protein
VFGKLAEQWEVHPHLSELCIRSLPCVLAKGFEQQLQQEDDDVFFGGVAAA